MNIKKIGVICILASTIHQQLSAQKMDITLEDVFVKNTFRANGVPGFNPMNDEKYFTKIDYNQNSKNNYVIKYDLLKNNALDTLFNSSVLNEESLQLEQYSFDENESNLLLQFNGQNIYRRSILYKTYVYNIKSKEIILIDEEPILHASFNPQGDKIAYIKNNNIYIYDINKKSSSAITNDGKWNHIINGNCDWVYEEEFSFTQAYQWSPDGQQLAYYKFDETNVKEFSMTIYNELYPEIYSYKYPKAGEDNSIVSIHIYNLQKNDHKKITQTNNVIEYIPRIQWANNTDLCILLLNRHQNKLDYSFYNTINNNIKSEIIDSNEAYVDITDPLIFTQNGQTVFYQSEKDGYNHVYKYDRKNKTTKQITKGNYDVDKLIGIDNKNNLFFTAGILSPINRGFYKININNNKLQPLSNENGWNTVLPFKSLQNFLVNYSSASIAPQYNLINNNGKSLHKLEDNSKLSQTISKYNISPRKYTTFTSADGRTKLNAYVIEPYNMEVGKKYPVLMYQYSGPGSQEVKNSFNLGNYYWHQYMASQGYIIVCVDGRGTGARGNDFKKSNYLNLGKLESDDQIHVGNQLKQMTNVDPDRIGIWGWSYGGFMSISCILKGNETFKTAVSVAPVTNWRYYDNIYTERFMRTPQENANGYDDNSPISMINKLKGNLLIIHGTADDNVHFQNAVAITNELIKENKQFESIYYPNKDHGIGGGNTRYQLFNKITSYIKKNL